MPQRVAARFTPVYTGGKAEMANTGKYDFSRILRQMTRKRSIQVNSIFNPFHTEYFYDILVLHEYWVLTENKIPLKPVLGGVRIVALPISFHEQTQ